MKVKGEKEMNAVKNNEKLISENERRKKVNEMNNNEKPYDMKLKVEENVKMKEEKYQWK